jgi:hypothetical protein
LGEGETGGKKKEKERGKTYRYQTHPPPPSLSQGSTFPDGPNRFHNTPAKSFAASPLENLIRLELPPILNITFFPQPR